MRLLIVVYDEGIDPTVMEYLGALELTGWTKVSFAQGEGGAGRKLGDAVWPGHNNILYLQLPDDQIATVSQSLKELQASYKLKPGITIWSLPVEAL